MKVILLEDNQAHFDIIADILQSHDHELVWDFEEAILLMADFDAIRASNLDTAKRIKKAVSDIIDKIRDQVDFWIIDINWLGLQDPEEADEYGLEFNVEYNISNAIILSVTERKKYKKRVQGQCFISKLDKQGELFNDNFERELITALSNTKPIIPTQQSPYDYK